jgi:hypothetical protein
LHDTRLQRSCSKSQIRLDPASSPPLGAVKVDEWLQPSALLAEAPQAVTAASLVQLLGLQEAAAAAG